MGFEPVGSHQHHVTMGLKVFHVLLSLIIMVLARIGKKLADEEYVDLLDESDATYNVGFGDRTNVNHIIFGTFVAWGFYFIFGIQLISYFFKEDPFRMNILFDLVGGACYIALGAIHIAENSDDAVKEANELVGKGFQSGLIANGALCILLGIFLLISAGHLIFAKRHRLTTIGSGGGDHDH